MGSLVSIVEKIYSSVAQYFYKLLGHSSHGARAELGFEQNVQNFLLVFAARHWTDLLRLPPTEVIANALRGTGERPVEDTEPYWTGNGNRVKECRCFYGKVGGLDCDEPEEKKRANVKAKKRSRRKKRKLMIDNHKSACGDGSYRESVVPFTGAKNPIVKKWEELMSDDWKESIFRCVRCQTGLAKGQGLSCFSCHVTRNHGNRFNRRSSEEDVVEESPSFFAFKKAEAEVRQLEKPFVPLLQTMGIKLPPVSYFLGSIPGPDIYNLIGMSAPVLLEITFSGIDPDFKYWILTVRDVTNATGTALIDTNETSWPFKSANKPIHRLQHSSWKFHPHNKRLRDYYRKRQFPDKFRRIPVCWWGKLV